VYFSVIHTVEQNIFLWKGLAQSPLQFQKCTLKTMGLGSIVQIWMRAKASLEFRGMWEVDSIV